MRWKPRHKFRAVRTTVDEKKFDSKLEATRYVQLKMLQDNKDIFFFLRRVPFHLPGDVTYRCDFMVFWANGDITIEDVKGIELQSFKDKKKMVEELYPVEIKVLKKEDLR